MARGSKPGERRGGRQRPTRNKRTAVRERLLAIASANPMAAVHELLLSLVNDPRCLQIRGYPPEERWADFSDGEEKS
jgi:hypothetical protein